MARRNSIATEDRVTLRWVFLLMCTLAALSLVAQAYLQNQKTAAPLEFITH